jgi:hypothetical protein
VALLLLPNEKIEFEDIFVNLGLPEAVDKRYWRRPYTYIRDVPLSLSLSWVLGIDSLSMLQSNLAMKTLIPTPLNL